MLSEAADQQTLVRNAAQALHCGFHLQLMERGVEGVVLSGVEGGGGAPQDVACRCAL